MKNNIILTAVLLAVTSCTAFYQDYNTNPYEVTENQMQRDGYEVRSFLTAMQNWVIPTDVNQCQFTDALLGCVYGCYFADSNASFNVGKFSTFDPQSNWSEVFYETVYQRIISNYFELESVSSDRNATAIAKVIKVAGLHRVADAYGPIPYLHLNDPSYEEIPLDSEEEVYKAMIRDLTDAVTTLTESRAMTILPNADHISGGSLEKWCRLANSLKLRLAMRLVYADADYARQTAEEAVNSEVGVMEDNDDNAMFSGFGKDGNPFNVMFYTYKSGKGDHKIAAEIICYMNGYNDPRREAYFTVSDFGDDNGYVGLRNGINIPETSEVDRYSSYNVTAASSLMWMNCSEVSFLMAEGALRGWDMGSDAKTLYERGIRQSFERSGCSKKFGEYISDGTSRPTSYLDPGLGHNASIRSDCTVKWDEETSFEEKLERLIIQKWIANFPVGNEAWADYRRTGYPARFPAVVNNSPDVDSELGARRLVYPLREYSTNGAAISDAVNKHLGGEDKMSVRLWWDCNPRIR
ncbi:MAG: SusD/RagB family nutrient-binding outer membrane lipoprotein [Candidatus Cryptobacteroides sp.]